MTTKPQDVETVFHTIGFKGWEVTQNGRSLLITDKSDGHTIELAPPEQWGRNWTWNLTDDGIFFKRGLR